MKIEGREQCAEYSVMLVCDMRPFPADGYIVYADTATGRVDWLDRTEQWKSRTLGKHQIRVVLRGVKYGIL